MGCGASGCAWELNGKVIDGGLAMGSQFPPNVPPHWLVYFTVASADDILKRTQELGGKVMAPATDIPEGRFAAFTDAQGAAFAVIQWPKK